MTANLHQTLAWKAATGDTLAMLENLQANIVRAHVRNSLSVMFLRFGPGASGAADARAFIRAVADPAVMKSAKQHLDEVEAFHASGAPGTAYVGLGLTAAGYTRLGVSTAPGDPSFTRGMKAPATRSALHDPPVTTWEPAYQDEIDAVLLIGDAGDTSTAARRNQVLDLFPDSLVLVAEETGIGQHNDADNGIEHFGYVDGRSQPLFLAEDVSDETSHAVGPTAWNPAFHLDRVLVHDPAAPIPGPDCGSYFVFRKLEQNVRRFKQGESDLADALGLKGEDRERAGAMIIGRFEDGTPLTEDDEAQGDANVENNFNYDDDGNGLRCPFQAHIRKSNPRGSGGFESHPLERKHIMARRGQTYGVRADDPNADLPPESRPSAGVGLLFMAFNASIGEQFEFVQQNWVNFGDFPKVPPAMAAAGLDPVIGQGPRTVSNFQPVYGAQATQVVDTMPQAVTMRGGEYFFMPSLSFLRAL